MCKRFLLARRMKRKQRRRMGAKVDGVEESLWLDLAIHRRLWRPHASWATLKQHYSSVEPNTVLLSPVS
jgi:hypothetical protein